MQSWLQKGSPTVFVWLPNNRKLQRWHRFTRELQIIRIPVPIFSLSYLWFILHGILWHLRYFSDILQVMSWYFWSAIALVISIFAWRVIYPLVMTNIAMENPPFLMGKSTTSMAIFNSFLLVTVSSPEGNRAGMSPRDASLQVPIFLRPPAVGRT